MSQQLILKKSEIQSFLECVGKINDAAVVTIAETEISAIVATPNNNLFLWATLPIDTTVNAVLNLPSISKLINLLKMINNSDIVFELTNNSLIYKDKNIKFKYHLHANGLLSIPKISIDKIKSFTYDVDVDVNKAFLSSIIKTSSIFKDTNKLYLFTEDSELKWSLGDKTIMGSDSFCVSSGVVEYTLNPFILDLDNVKLISFASENEMKLSINDKIGFGNFQLESNNLKLNYITSSLAK